MFEYNELVMNNGNKWIGDGTNHGNKLFGALVNTAEHFDPFLNSNKLWWLKPQTVQCCERRNLHCCIP